MNPILVGLILEFIVKLIEFWISKQGEGESLTVGEQKIVGKVVEVIDMILPYMTQRQHRRFDVKIRNLKELLNVN